MLEHIQLKLNVLQFFRWSHFRTENRFPPGSGPGQAFLKMLWDAGYLPGVAFAFNA